MQSFLGIINFTIATPQKLALYPVSTVNAFVLSSQLMQLKLICHNLIVTDLSQCAILTCSLCGFQQSFSEGLVFSHLRNHEVVVCPYNTVVTVQMVTHVSMHTKTETMQAVQIFPIPTSCQTIY